MIEVAHLTRDDAESAKLLIDGRLSERPQRPQANQPSLADELNRLSELHERQLLTNDEFATAKATLLGS